MEGEEGPGLHLFNEPRGPKGWEEGGYIEEVTGHFQSMWKEVLTLHFPPEDLNSWLGFFQLECPEISGNTSDYIYPPHFFKW